MMILSEVQSFSLPPVIIQNAQALRFRHRRVAMQLAPDATTELKQATRIALGHGDNLKGLELAHELSMNELAVRPWKTFFDTLAANKVFFLFAL